MIARLTGQVIEKTPISVVLEVAGVGYELLVSNRLLNNLNPDQQVSLHVAEHIKEDEYSLFGFESSAERATYYQLTSVSGVGPKAAMAILSAHEVADIQKSITEGDTSIFSNVSGVGNKTAQRIILELKGKLVNPIKPQISNDDQAYQALLALGFSGLDAKQALSKVDSKLDTQERIKQALTEIGK